MRRTLTPSDQARFLALALLSAALFALALALTYFAYQIGALRRQIPELLAAVEQTSLKVEPMVREAGAIRDTISPILKEVKAVRELVPGVMAEVQAVRQALPPLIDTGAKAINNASDAVRVIEPRIPAVLSEMRKTREALPGILDRAEQVVARAGAVGQKAGEGAVKGVIGGIVSAPFQLIGGVGKGLTGLIGLENRREFTAADEKLAGDATDAAIKNGQVGAQSTWQNPESKNRGSVTLTEKWARDGRPCVTLRHRIEFRTEPVHEKDIHLCQRPDKSWEEAKR